MTRRLPVTNRAKRAARGLPPNRRNITVAEADPTTGAIVKRKVDPCKDVMFRRLGESMPQEEFMAVMEASSDPRAQACLKLLIDPRYQRRTLAWIAREAGLSYIDVVMMFRTHGLGDGTMRMVRRAPEVMEDVAVDSLSREVTCSACRGYMVGLVASVPVMESATDDDGKAIVRQKLNDEGALMWERCLTCDGEGTIRIEGSHEARKLMFETLKLTGQKGPLIANQINLGGSSTMEDAVASAHDAIDLPALKDSNEQPHRD